MEAGVDCWDEYGRSVLSVTDRLTQVLGTVGVQAGVAGSIVVPMTGANNEVWLFFQCDNGGNIHTVTPTFTISGSTISWEFRVSPIVNPPRIGGTLMYGRY